MEVWSLAFRVPDGAEPSDPVVAIFDDGAEATVANLSVDEYEQMRTVMWNSGRGPLWDNGEHLRRA